MHMMPASVGDGVIVTDAAGCVTFMNQIAQELTGRSAANGLNRPLSEVFPIVDEARGDVGVDLMAQIMSAATAAALARPCILLRADGTRVRLDTSAAPVRLADTTLSGSVVTFRISGASHAGQVGAHKDRPRDDFLASLAHELRNPLAPIRNALQIMQLVQDDSDGATTSAARVIIERQLKHLTRLIEDLLDMSRIAQGDFELRKERTSLWDVVQLALAHARPQLEGKQHRLQIEFASKDLYLVADGARLAHAIANLLHNASKFSAAGTAIRVTAGTENDELVVRVVDHGVGIPPDMFERVFDLYGQVDRAEDGTHDGLGIGLTLVRRIVELHGGTVTATSAGQGRGSEFIVRLPRDKSIAGSDAARRAAAPPEPARRLRILIADDNRDAAHTLEILLSLEGHEVRAVHDGVEALTAGDEFAPQLVLLDIGMPLLDGYETARQIQERPWGKHAHLVALTGWGQEADRRRAMKAGFRDHLVKPAEPEALKAVIDRIGAD
jgi:signal transduction histidine kinase/ActR/RegA family two-component response regulator